MRLVSSSATSKRLPSLVPPQCDHSSEGSIAGRNDNLLVSARLLMCHFEARTFPDGLCVPPSSFVSDLTCQHQHSL